MHSTDQNDPVGDLFNSIDKERHEIIDYCREIIPQIVRETGFGGFEVVKDEDDEFVLGISLKTNNDEMTYHLTVSKNNIVYLTIHDYQKEYYRHNNNLIISMLRNADDVALSGDYFFDNLNGGIVPSSDRQRSTFKNFKTLETTLSKGKEFVKKVLAYSVDIAGFAPDLKDENDRPISRPPSAPKGRMKRDNSF